MADNFQHESINSSIYLRIYGQIKLLNMHTNVASYVANCAVHATIQNSYIRAIHAWCHLQ